MCDAVHGGPQTAGLLCLFCCDASHTGMFARVATYPADRFILAELLGRGKTVVCRVCMNTRYTLGAAKVEN